MVRPTQFVPNWILIMNILLSLLQSVIVKVGKQPKNCKNMNVCFVCKDVVNTPLVQN